MIRLAPLLLLAFFFLPSCAEDAPPVIINGAELSDEKLDELEGSYGNRPTGGPWWYDRLSGLYGAEGGPALGFMMPGHELGAMRSDCSGGGTGVYINGRDLSVQEYATWSATFGSLIMPGRYWLDGFTNYGFEGFPAAGNLIQVISFRMQQMGGDGAGAGGGDNFWSSRFGAGNSTADGSAGYVSVPGHGPIGYGM